MLPTAEITIIDKVAEGIAKYKGGQQGCILSPIRGVSV